ncbi:tryptophan dimethylallyltransferase-domain-containing protein [Aspergillus ambiguus]|uniref:tryptophan dimethylallyltransferase-domain-containing protein n=1 Tax=Aspergillus ambiguus TaxID=176160 RepID=UPI003CCCD480
MVNGGVTTKPAISLQGVREVPGNFSDSIHAQFLPYDILTKFLNFSDEAQRSWWEDSGSMLSRFLEATDYNHLIPFMGPHPQIRRYLFIPYGTPVEFSINFQGKRKALLRMALEPVSSSSGTKEDLYNMTAVSRFEATLEQINQKIYNMGLYKHFTEQFLPSQSEIEKLREREASADAEGFMSTAAFGFDFKGGEDVTIKDKYFPSSTGDPPTSPISWDYGSPDTSRIKLFGATYNITLEAMQEIWTLGGRLNTETSQRGLELAKRLWDFLGMEDQIRKFGNTEHNVETSMAWNYEIWPGAQYPIPKIYFPVLGMNDERVSEAISKFFHALGWAKRAESYPKMLKTIYPIVDLSRSTQLQTWVSFSYTEKAGAYTTVHYQSAMNSVQL